jgi:hypothetical protein
MLKGYNKCSSCVRKGVKACDGNFSKAEFNSLESKKKEFRSKALAQRAKVARLAAKAVNTYTTLIKAQQAEIEFKRKAEKYTEA